MSKTVRGVVALTVGSALLLTPGATRLHGPASPAEAAQALLAADSAGSTTQALASGGKLRWFGTGSGAEVHNPDVTPGQSPEDAAAAHLRRYGAAFGLDGDGSRLTVARKHDAVHTHVTIFDQAIDGVPVLASGVSVETGADGQLRSVLADVSSATSVPDVVVPEATAAQTARSVVARRDGAGAGLRVERNGRAVYDPAVIGADPSLGRHSVWGFTVSAGPETERSVLIDDQTGAIVADMNLSEGLDRVVCDNANVQQSNTTICTSGFARTETGPASAQADVNRAFDELGATAQFYADTAGVDLTALLGRSINGTKHLAATVRYCESGVSCPMANAFWFNQQMYTGAGWNVDDVVGHEMTHGVIEKNANLFYWGQSGAINEGLADVMGEQIDRRLALPGEPADVWLLGEQAPGGAVRNMADPAAKGQPDRTGSASYTNDPNQNDSGGVHTNSGVLLKTFYLASQGGTFNGHTVTSIDGADASTTKSAKLWWQVIQRLVPGSDFADLGLVLDQACGDLVGTAGFTAANCTQVHEAGLATELAITPTKAAQPADAPDSCPDGLARRVLLSSEAAPASFSSASSAWNRNIDANWGANAHSGHDAWHIAGTTTRASVSLAAATPVALPAGQPAYLRFQQWRFLDTEPGIYYDAGTVELTDSVYGGLTGESFPASSWVNGPQQTIASGEGNPAQGRTGFGGDSRGWVASRLDLSVLAGHSVRPQFTLNTDSLYAWLPWFLDDIEVYTCDPAATPTPTVTPSETVSPTDTASPTETASPTDTATATDTASPTDTATATETASPTDTATATETASPTDTATATDTASPTGTTSPTVTATPAVAPGAPTSVVVQPSATALSATLSWGAPASAGSGITGYEVTRSDGKKWVYSWPGGVTHTVPANTSLEYRIRTLGLDGTASAVVRRTLTARAVSLGALPSKVRTGSTLTLSGLLTRVPGGAALGGQVATVQYLPAGSSTWRTRKRSNGATVTATSSSTGKLVAKIVATRGTRSYRFFLTGWRSGTNGWLRAFSVARKVIVS